MAVDIDIQLDPRELAKAERLLKAIPRALPGIMSSSVNRAGVTARSRITKGIGSILPITQKSIRSRTRIRRATRRNPEAIVSLFDERIPLSRLRPKQTAEGVTYESADGRVLDPGSFIIESELPISGKTGVFRRIGLSRLPIRERFASSLLKVWSENPAIAQDVERAASETLTKRVRSGIERALQRRAERLARQ